VLTPFVGRIGFLTRVAHVSTYTCIGIKGYESERKRKFTLCSQPQPKLLVRLTISKVERKLIVVSILYILVVRSCSILKWDLWNPSNTFVLYWIEIR